MKLAAFLLSILLCSFIYAEETELQKADQLAGRKKYDEALQILRDYAKAHPQDMEPHDRIQRILTRQSKDKEAIEEYRLLYEQQPAPMHGYLYARLIESPVEREAFFRKLIAADASYAWSHVGLASALMDQDRLQEGVDAASAGLSAASDPTEIHYILARIYRRMQKFGEAAASAQEYNRLKPGEDSENLAYSYAWLQVKNTDSDKEQLKLAQDWLAKFRNRMLDEEGLSGALQIAELLFIFADNEKEPAATRKYAALALEKLSKEKPAASGEDRDLYFRAKGALLALQALGEIQLGGTSRVHGLLEEAQKSGPSSEMYYFSALAEKASGDQKNASKNALKAAAYPPVYPKAYELAARLWKETGADPDKLEGALHNQRLAFSQHRKKLVLSQIVSQKVPEFEAADSSGKTITKKDLSGKVTLLNFWAVWCPPCREELPHWNAFVARHASDKDLQLLAVGDEPWETMLNYMKNHDFTFPVYRSEKYWEEFEIEGIPTLLVIDSNGSIRFRNAGFEEGMEYEETLLWQIEAARK